MTQARLQELIAKFTAGLAEEGEQQELVQLLKGNPQGGDLGALEIVLEALLYRAGGRDARAIQEARASLQEIRERTLQKPAEMFKALIGKRVRVPVLSAHPITILTVFEERDGCFNVRYRRDDGVEETSLADRADLLSAVVLTASEAAYVSPMELFLFLESNRIRLAYSHDPHMAVSLSGIEPLPHQLEAVYSRMLPQVALRFLLADDPGAGKTIMAGMLIKELKLREVIERILIVSPAALTIQWQDEMFSKFGEIFEVLGSDIVGSQVAGNVWGRFPQVITSLDYAKREGVWEDILSARWDLVIVDEAHKCSARTYGDEVKKTKRYQFAERLSSEAPRLLLLTATPHQGDAEQFWHFLRLIDPDQFTGRDINREVIRLEGNPWFLRRMKEDLRDFDGRRLFPERHAVTKPFDLSPGEFDLYKAVTDYVEKYLTQSKGRKRNSAALARTVLQRRLASSVRAIHLSLEKRYDRFKDVLEQAELLPPDKRIKLLQERNLLPEDEELEEGDLSERDADEAALAITAERLDVLREEVETLTKLVAKSLALEEASQRGAQALAKQHQGLGAIAQGEMDLCERKLLALYRALQTADFSELKDGRGKLLIFTEHRDTLNYLVENLQAWGYTTVEIHGGMNARQRKEQQAAFAHSAQVCVATEAAGEGINLQFCHLMINYDIPWNPTRLEQRLGRIHRIGQKRDVHAFNFVATNTVEGGILERLFSKMNDMRAALGGRVFDVIGMILKLNGLDLEEMLREAARNPRLLAEYQDKIASIDPDKLRQLEEETGVALATQHVDLRRILSKTRGEDYRSAERRLMPEFVEHFFRMAAQKVDLRMEERADGLLRIPHIPERFRAPSLDSVKRFGSPDQNYLKVTFNKTDLQEIRHSDAILLSPGHPLFASVDELLLRGLESVRGKWAHFKDPAAPEPYLLMFFEVRVSGGVAKGRSRPDSETKPVNARLVAVLEDKDGKFQIAAPDILHDLTYAQDQALPMPVPSQDRIDQIIKWLRSEIQMPMLRDGRAQRQRELEIRREYLEKAIDAEIARLSERLLSFTERVDVFGEENLRGIRNAAEQELRDAEYRKVMRLADLEALRVVKDGPITFLGGAVVSVLSVATGSWMRRDEEVENTAIDVVMEYERSQGREPEYVGDLKDGSGFDIRSLGPIGPDNKREIRRIEVKGRAGTGPVLLSPNEWIQANRHQDSYWLYIVYDCGAKPRLHAPVQNPATILRDRIKPIREVKGYMIPDLSREVGQ